MPDAESQIASYFARYEPAIAKHGKAVRAKLRARLPGLFEIVYMYERQRAFVISYSPTERGFEGVCSISVYPDTVKLGFVNGAQLSNSDPKKLLQGSGKMVRYVTLGSAADFDRPEIEALIAAAVKLADLHLDPNKSGGVVVKAEEQKQRTRRAAGPRRTSARA